MKTFINRLWVLGALALLAFGMAGPPAAQARPGDRVSFQTFYDELDPYGRWINDPDYGYVWSPRVERDFQPYATRGHWVMTDYGNTWVSDYEWGWAPFHYGRWLYDDYYGWLWVPGSDWGPAWVDWRHSNGYYGWAPMGPRVTYIVPATRWVFVPVRYITSPRVYSYYVPRTQVVNIYHQTTIINNYYERDNRKYVYGPRNQDIERATNRKVNVYRVDNDSRPGRNVVADNTVRLYRPEVSTRRTEAPTRVEARDNSSTRTRQADASSNLGRVDRSSNTDANHTGNSPARTRQISTGTTSSSRSQAAVEGTGEPRSVSEGTRQRETTRARTSSPASSDGYSPPVRTRRIESQRPQEGSGTTTRSRSSVPAPVQRSEGSYSPARTEASPQGQYQQPRSRQMTTPAQAPAAAPRSSTSRQEPAGGSDSGTRTRRN